MIIAKKKDNNFTTEVAISEEKKQEYIERVKSCPVCNILSNEKEFLELK